MCWDPHNDHRRHFRPGWQWPLLLPKTQFGDVVDHRSKSNSVKLRNFKRFSCGLRFSMTPSSTEILHKGTRDHATREFCARRIVLQYTEFWVPYTPGQEGHTPGGGAQALVSFGCSPR